VARCLAKRKLRRQANGQPVADAFGSNEFCTVSLTAAHGAATANRLAGPASESSNNRSVLQLGKPGMGSLG
jgi:hypothetical protein